MSTGTPPTYSAEKQGEPAGVHPDVSFQSHQANTTWAEKNMGQSWQYRFFHVMLRWFGKRPAYYIMYIVTFWYVLMYSKIRKRTRPYLKRRFPEHRSLIRQFWDSYQLIRHFGMTLVDMAAAQIIGPSVVHAMCPNDDQFAKLAASSQGFLLLNAHIGCWQVGLTTLPNVGKRVALGLIPDPRVLPSIDPKTSYIIDPTMGFMAVMQMTRALLEGDVVSLMADRVHGDQNNVVKVNFMGDPLSIPIAAYRLASATGCPIVLLAAMKTGYKSYEVSILDQFQIPPHLGSRPEHYESYAQRVADALERMCMKYPWQFFNFYDLWSIHENELEIKPHS